MVSDVRNEYTKRKKVLDSQLKEAAQRESNASDLITNYKSKVKEESFRQTANYKNKLQEKYDKKLLSVDKEYQAKTGAFWGVTSGALLYGLFTTILTACLSERFSKDFTKFLSTLWSGISGIFALAVNCASHTWSISKLIPYRYLNIVLAGLLSAIVFTLIIGILYGIIGFLLYKCGKLYNKQFAGNASLIVALTSMAIIVWFADYLSFIPINLVIVWIIIHILYLLIRFLLTSKKTDYY